jgi:hypothetical protein
VNLARILEHLRANVRPNAPRWVGLAGVMARQGRQTVARHPPIVARRRAHPSAARRHCNRADLFLHASITRRNNNRDEALKVFLQNSLDTVTIGFIWGNGRRWSVRVD